MLENGSFISMLPELFCCEKVVFSSYETGRRYQEIVSEIRFARGKKKKKRSVNGLQFISKEFDMLLGLNAVKYDHVASFHLAQKGVVEHFYFRPLTRQSCKCKVTRKAEYDTLFGSLTSFHCKRLYLSP